LETYLAHKLLYNKIEIQIETLRLTLFVDAGKYVADQHLKNECTRLSEVRPTVGHQPKVYSHQNSSKNVWNAKETADEKKYH
jgi:hypothetical protein